MKYPDICPICGCKLVKPSGSSKSKVMVMGEFPGIEEVRKGIPWIGKAGNVLRTELAILGLDLSCLRVSNLWLHEDTKNQDCKTFCYGLGLQELENKELVLFLGSETANFFSSGKLGVKELCGLHIEPQDELYKQLNYISVPNVMFCINPAQVLKAGGLGEVRLAFKRFVDIAWSYTE